MFKDMNELPLKLYCPMHKVVLKLNAIENSYFSPCGCTFPIIGHIPRFAFSEDYASSFGLQWNQYRTTQLDSHTGLTISRDRLTRLLGGALDMVKDKKVLEAGCGAGRFSEILLEAGAYLYAIDLSTAVEANYKNCGSFPNYFICQADILELPFPPEEFDVVICIGVIQHTPDPEKTIAALCRQVKPGGILVIDHYTYGYAATPSRRALHFLLAGRPARFSLCFCQGLVGVLWPLHRLVWKLRHYQWISKFRHAFLYFSPVIDYQEAYPKLRRDLLRAWAILDTHDTLTDVYKNLRSAEEIASYLQQCGMTDIDTIYAGNGIEARARKPAPLAGTSESVILGSNGGSQ
jgi:SAM-dependent methyltransferase